MTEGFLRLKEYLSALAENTIFQLEFEYLDRVLFSVTAENQDASDVKEIVKS